MAAKEMDMFDAPIPGQSLAGELGSKPWEKPAKYNTVDEVLKFYIGQMTQPKLLGPFLDQVKEGIPISTLVQALSTSAVMEGLHTLDVGLLAAPVLVEFLALQAEEAGIKFTVGDEDSDLPDQGAIDALVDSLILGESPINMGEPTMEISTEEVPVEENESPLGMMARRVV
tara:strand:+ start:1107 stop:1619 length:513 start_codon:yes stop_codon:yes gene_type:complete